MSLHPEANSQVRAAIYLRQSQDRRGTGLAVERQLEACHRLCEQRGWTIIRVLDQDNDTSAFSAKRPGYAELLTLAESGAVEIIVCWHVDRLTRKLTDLEHLIELCERTGVKIATVTGDIDLSTDTGRLIGRILASVAKGEVERKSTRQKAANLQKAQAGKRHDKRAFGYQQDGSIHPVEAPIVQELYRRFIAGASTTSLMHYLNDTDYPTVRGNRWERTSIKWLLSNLRYAGIRTYKGQEMGDGDWPVLIPEETVRASKAILDDPSRLKVKDFSRKWLGSALYLCGKCASNDIVSTMTVAYGTSGYRQYRCQHQGLRHSDGGCWMTRKAEPIDTLVKGVMVERLRNEDIGSLMAQESPDITPLRTEASSLRKRIDQLADNVSLSESVLVRRVDALERRLEAVQGELAVAGQASALGSLAGAEDAGAAWLGLVTSDVLAAQAITAECFKITLLQVPRGSRNFNPETVVFSKP